MYACASVNSYMNNKSKVIHEIEILLIVGNELLRILNGSASLIA